MKSKAPIETVPLDGLVDCFEIYLNQNAQFIFFIACNHGYLNIF
jgi:hypothetical protein